MLPALAVDGLDGGTEDRPIAGQQRREGNALVDTAIEIGKIVRDFLEAEHIGIVQRLGNRHDAGKVDHAVAAFAALDIPGDELHRTRTRMMPWIPALRL